MKRGSKQEIKQVFDKINFAAKISQLKVEILGIVEDPEKLVYRDDPVLRKKGYEIYDMIDRDSQISSSMLMRKILMISMISKIDTPTENKIALFLQKHKRTSADTIINCFRENKNEVIKLFREVGIKQLRKFAEKQVDTLGYTIKMVDRMKTSFIRMLSNAMDAFPKGWSCQEIIYDTNKEEQIIAEEVKNKDVKNLKLEIDKFNNVIGLKYRTGWNWSKSLKDFRKYILYNHNPKYDNPYGTSIYRDLYEDWVGKMINLKLWDIGNEKSALGITLGKYPSGISDELFTQFFDMVRRLKTASVGVIDEIFSVEFAKAIQGNLEMIERRIRYSDEQIAKRILGGALMLGAGDKGSFNFGETRKELVFKMLYIQVEDFVEAINEQFFRRLNVMNFGDIDYYARLVRSKTISSEDFSKIANAIAQLKNAGYEISIEDIEEKTGLKAVNTTEMVKDYEKLYGEVKYEVSLKDNEDNSLIKKYKENLLFETNILEEKYKEKLIKVYEDISERFIKNLSSKWNSIVKNIDNIDKLQIYKTDLKKTIIDMLEDSYISGKKFAKNEIKDKLKSFVLVFQEGLIERGMQEVINKRGFYITGVESEKILKNTKGIIKGGLAEGLTELEIIGNVKDEIVDFQKASVIVRTNITEFYKEGYVKECNKISEIVGYQYVAIEDNRTTPFCSSWHGRIVVKDSPDVFDLCPSHFGCRSSWRAVWEDEGLEISPICPSYFNYRLMQQETSCPNISRDKDFYKARKKLLDMEKQRMSELKNIKETHPYKGKSADEIVEEAGKNMDDFVKDIKKILAEYRADFPGDELPEAYEMMPQFIKNWEKSRKRILSELKRIVDSALEKIVKVEYAHGTTTKALKKIFKSKKILPMNDGFFDIALGDIRPANLIFNENTSMQTYFAAVPEGSGFSWFGNVRIVVSGTTEFTNATVCKNFNNVLMRYFESKDAFSATGLTDDYLYLLTKDNLKYLRIEQTIDEVMVSFQVKNTVEKGISAMWKQANEIWSYVDNPMMEIQRYDVLGIESIKAIIISNKAEYQSFKSLYGELCEEFGIDLIEVAPGAL